MQISIFLTLLLYYGTLSHISEDVGIYDVTDTGEKRILIKDALMYFAYCWNLYKVSAILLC